MTMGAVPFTVHSCGKCGIFSMASQRVQWDQLAPPRHTHHASQHAGSSPAEAAAQRDTTYRHC